VEVGDRVAESVVVDEGSLAGGQAVNIGAEDLLGADFHFDDLVARLGIVGGGDDHVDAAIEGRGAEFRVKGDGKARLRRGFFLRRCGRSAASLRGCEERRQTQRRVLGEPGCSAVRTARDELRETRHEGSLREQRIMFQKRAIVADGWTNVA
jgi:hypothetical protein